MVSEVSYTARISSMKLRERERERIHNQSNKVKTYKIRTWRKKFYFEKVSLFHISLMPFLVS